MTTQLLLTPRPAAARNVAADRNVHASRAARFETRARRARAERLDAAKLQAIEERLLQGAIEHHPNRDRAIAHLLSDVERHGAEAGHAGNAIRDAAPAARMLPPRQAAQVERMEDLLLQAIIRTHPNREMAIDRLLGDVVGDAAIDDVDDDAERARFDMSIDGDWDGMA